jgi:phosphate transport system permease protein
LKKHDTVSVLLRGVVYLAAAMTVASFLLLVGYILVRGIPNLNPGLFAWKYSSENNSMLPAIINTVIMTGIALVVAAPLGIFTAIYLAEYARRGSRFVKIVRTAAETLSGIPSIVYGLFGFLFFLTRLGWGFSLLSGAFTLAIMILPLIMRTAEEAIRSVSDSYREGSFGLGAGRLRTVFRIVLPAAMPGILAGIILAIGRVVGETAALIYTAGTVAELPKSLLSSTRTLSVHMYVLSNEGLHMGAAFATAAVLLLLVALINALSSLAAKKLGGGGNK